MAFTLNRDAIQKEGIIAAELYVDSDSDTTIDNGICTLAEGYDMFSYTEKVLKTIKTKHIRRNQTGETFVKIVAVKDVTDSDKFMTN
ncbi:hypothetical protein DPMN_030058 [Dreissena polymorpha]|uniref:Uncharacterized protein n=1 Tax=Dreissena polymorpha TaxID=45954 RepID=A0A9D4LZ89_DREPO|nr:hypothetical protein DPMN_030058 [Dreissena polymorpha]